MKEKVLKAFKIIGIVVFFPLVFLFCLTCVVVNVVLTAIDSAPKHFHRLSLAG